MALDPQHPIRPAIDVRVIEGAANVTINPGEIEIGKVVQKDDTDATTARVKAPSALLETDGAGAVHDFILGLTNGAVLAADAAATLQQYLRTLLVNLGYLDAAKVDTDVVGSISSKLRGAVSRLVELVTTTGVISGVAVVTDANGTLQQYLRGLVTALIPVTGATADAAVVTDANGTLSGKLRGLVTLLAAMSAKLPAALGPATSAASLSVVQASDSADSPIYPVRSGAGDVVSVSGVSAQSGALAVGRYLMIAETACWYEVAANPTAVWGTAPCKYLPAGGEFPIRIAVANNKVAFITSGAAAKAVVFPVS